MREPDDSAASVPQVVLWPSSQRACPSPEVRRLQLGFSVSRRLQQETSPTSSESQRRSAPMVPRAVARLQLKRHRRHKRREAPPRPQWLQEGVVATGPAHTRATPRQPAQQNKMAAAPLGAWRKRVARLLPASSRGSPWLGSSAVSARPDRRYFPVSRRNSEGLQQRLEGLNQLGTGACAWEWGLDAKEGRARNLRGEEDEGGRFGWEGRRDAGVD